DMVGNLLMLARLESGSSAKASQTCRLDQMLAQQLVHFSDRIVERNVTLDNSAITPAAVLAPPELLTLVIRNVLDNAVSYANEKGAIRVSLRKTDHGIVLEVANTGSAVSSAQSEQVFERFWRGDASRTDQGRHSGLGLSIVQNVMRQIGGGVTVESSVGGWFTVVLLFPKHGGDGSHEV
ncbi:MAG: sensor histidine kinase, partial [Phycisphaerae bacterium]